MRLPRKARLRLTALAPLGTAVLLFSACDALVPPLMVQNSTPEEISISFYYKESTRTLRIADQDGGGFMDSLTIATGGAPTILFADVELPQYTLVVKDSADQKKFVGHSLKKS